MQAPYNLPILDRCRSASAAGVPGLRGIMDLHRGLDITSADRETLFRPDPARPYGRRVLLANDVLEVMVATWTRGTPCAPHDHGGAAGAVQVLQGRSRHRVWKIQNGVLVQVAEEVVEAGGLMACGADVIHSMGDDGADEQLMTLHLYNPGIDFMVVYDQSMDRTLVVDGDCGAWVPEPDRVRRTSPGVVPRAVVVG
jgi:hypothetical protein